MNTPSVTPRRGGLPLITELGSVPERRTLFDDDKPYETRAERSQVVDSPFHEEFREICSEEHRTNWVGILRRPTPPIKTSKEALNLLLYQFQVFWNMEENQHLHEALKL